MTRRTISYILTAVVAVVAMALVVGTTSSAMAQQEGEVVTVNGTVTRYVDDDEVIFSDGTNSVQVEFKDDGVNLPPVNTPIVMTMEIEKAELKDNEFEVRLISWEPAGGAQPADAPPAPGPVVGSSGDLLAGVPEPADAEFKAEDAIQEGGRHFFYTSGKAPMDVVSSYEAALQAAGWNIVSSGGGGDPFGMFGGSGGLTATNGARYLKLNAGGPPGSTFINACIWPAQPNDDNCGQNQNQDSGVMGAGGDLLAGVPEVGNAEFKAEDSIQEGGRHFFYTSGNSPVDVVSAYESALTAAGRNIVSSGGGGDPFGMFGGGANLTATNGARYLKLNAGGPPGSTFVDACIWPAQPSDDNCGQNQNQQSDSAVMGAGGDLLAGIPEPADAEFKAEDAIQEGGRHFFYTSSKSSGEAVSAYQSALQAAGWNILSSGGDPFGMFGGGLTASDGTRYLKFNAGGPGGQAFINACVWPAQPGDDNCGQNQQTSGAATMGSSGDLLTGVPEPADAEFKAEDAIQEGGRHFFYTSSKSPGDLVSAYQSALQATGWNIESSGGDPFGMFGGGLTATNGARYLKFNAGGPGGQAFINACVWPVQPNDNNCGQNQNQQTSGAGIMGSGGDLMAGVPELANAEFKAEDAIQEGGRHFFFTSSTPPGDVVSAYQSALEANGWNIASSGGDPFGMFGAGLTATNGTRYLKLNAGGPPGSTFINGCVWPVQPNDNNCGQNQNQQTSGTATMGSGGDLLAGVPEVANVEFKSEDAIHEGGRHFFFTSSAPPGDIVSGYESALTAAGWNILSSGGGGDPFGMFGGSAGLSATDGTRYIALNAGGPAGQTFVDGCIWPSQPSNNNCGQNNN